MRRPERRLSVARFFLALGVVMLLTGVAASAGAGRDWVRFRHTDYGFSIAYPRGGWEVLSGTGQAAFVAIGPVVDVRAGTRMGVVVVTAPIRAGANLGEAGARLEQQLARSAQTIRILRTDRIDLRGIPAAITYVHRKNLQGVELYQMMMIVAHRARGYGVAGTTAAASFTLTEDTRLLQSIVLTFQPPQ